MDMSFEDQIRERAYQIWEAGGMADGQAHEHWVSAEQAVRGAATVTAEPEVILTKAAPRKAAPKAATKAATKASADKSASAKTVKAKAAAAPKASRAKARKVVEATAH